MCHVRMRMYVHTPNTCKSTVRTWRIFIFTVKSMKACINFAINVSTNSTQKKKKLSKYDALLNDHSYKTRYPDCNR